MNSKNGKPLPVSVPEVERLSLLLRRGLQQECDRRSSTHRERSRRLTITPLWTGGFHGQPRPARPVVRRDARRRTRPGLLQLPLLQPQRRQMDQPRPHR